MLLDFRLLLGKLRTLTSCSSFCLRSNGGIKSLAPELRSGKVNSLPFVIADSFRGPFSKVFNIQYSGIRYSVFSTGSKQVWTLYSSCPQLAHLLPDHPWAEDP